MFYEDVFRALQRHRVRYLIVGGAAVNLHGVPRMTADLDLTVDMSPENIKALIDAMSAVGLDAAIPVDPLGLADREQRLKWQKEKNLRALTFQSKAAMESYREVDILVEPPLDFEEMYAEKTTLSAKEIEIDLVSLKHLIEIKRRLVREQDLADVKALEKILSEDNADE